MVRLFQPRKDCLEPYFAWDGPVLVGRTHTGRVTIALLEVNRPEAVELHGYVPRETL